MSPSRRRSLLCLALLSGSALAQAPQAPDAQLSPQAAYQDALHPLEVTRHNIANWSDVELAAMNVAVANAKTACEARHADDYTGSALVDLARLCALGQQWPDVIDAAGKYIIAGDSARPLLTDAYTAKTEAHLHIKQEPEALQTALDLLKAVPYSSEASQCITEAVDYMRFVHTTDALTLAAARQPLVLAALRASAAAPARAGAPPADALSASELYADGLSLAVLQQLASRPADAQATVNALEAALPAHLSVDDRLRIDQQRGQYKLLGKPLTGIRPLTSLSSPPNHLPQLPALRTITALLLFPDWCAACVHLGPQLPDSVFKVEGHSVYLYAVLAETVPPRKPDPAMTNAAFNPAYAAAMLAETPTVTVAPDTLTRFAAADYPLLLLTDAQGILRVLEPITAQGLQPGGDLDSAIALVGKNFASPATAAASTSVPSGRH